MRLTKPASLRTFSSISCLVLLISCCIATLFFKRGVAADKAVRPFYLERASYKRSASGQEVMFARDILARRSDATTASIEYFMTYLPVRKVTLPDTSMTWLIDGLKLKTSWPRMSEEALGITDRTTHPLADCGVGSRIVGHENIAGEDTVKVTDTVGAVSSTFWLAPALGCESLRFQKGNDDGTVLSEVRTLKLVIGEPDSRVFDPGVGYDEVVPSELTIRRYRAAGSELSAPEQLRMLRSFDREFHTLLSRYPR